MDLIQRAETCLDTAARKLLAQHKYSNGYISVGESEIAEANIVIHAASSLLNAGLHVWAESPFKTHDSNQCKHLDLLVDLTPGHPETSTLLTIEAKRVAEGENDKKVLEIVRDHGRVQSWKILSRSRCRSFSVFVIQSSGFLERSSSCCLKPVIDLATLKNLGSRRGGKEIHCALRGLRTLD